MPERELKQMAEILYWIQCVTGSRCRLWRIGLIWVDFLALHNSTEVVTESVDLAFDNWVDHRFRLFHACACFQFINHWTSVSCASGFSKVWSWCKHMPLSLWWATWLQKKKTLTERVCRTCIQIYSSVIYCGMRITHICMLDLQINRLFVLYVYTNLFLFHILWYENNSYLSVW